MIVLDLVSVHKGLRFIPMGSLPALFMCSSSKVSGSCLLPQLPASLFVGRIPQQVKVPDFVEQKAPIDPLTPFCGSVRYWLQPIWQNEP
jgi:hypothetical protein